MNVKQRLQVNTIASAIAVLVVALVVVIGFSRITGSLEKLDLADEILNGMFERNTLLHDYVMTNNERAREQWFAEHAQLGSQLQTAAQNFEAPEENKIVERMIQDHDATAVLFKAIVDDREKARSGSLSPELSNAVENRHLTQVNIRLYDKLLNIQELRVAARSRAFAELRFTSACILLFIIAVAALAAVRSWSMARFITTRIAKLRKGTTVIGRGNLQYRIDLAGDDELADFSRTFDAMSEKLGLSYLELRNEIKERKRAEENLRRLNESLEQRVSERTELAEARSRQLQALAVELIEAEERERRRIAQLLHDDLQQMLAAAKMQLQAVSDPMPEGSMLKNVGHILEDAIEKSRRTSHELSPAVLHQAGLVAGLQWVSRQMNAQFGLKTELEVNTDLRLESAPLQVFLFRAVQELVFNIVKHAGVNAALIEVADGNGFYTVAVSDQGKGFDPQKLDNAPNKIGFGLMTIRERANYIGGKLTIESAPGKGSRFTLAIPLKIAGENARSKMSPAPRQESAANLADTPQDAREIRVLFVDDHQVMRRGLIQLIANQPEIRVVGEASNGREAVELARQLKPDVVVMDVSMPEMDGIEATCIIKSEMPGVRVIGLSMHMDADIAQAMREAGAETFVSKTASPAELLMAIYDDVQRKSFRNRAAS